LTEEILDLYEEQIETFTLVPSDGGRFEFKVGDNMIYSKLETRRHAKSGEIAQLLGDFLKK
jgi:predicted Rdx family selenoprotein